MKIRATTILAVRHQGKLAVAGDGQVSMNNAVVKHHARKVRRIYNDRIIVGFAGATADALTLSEKLEERPWGNSTLETLFLFKTTSPPAVLIITILAASCPG